VVIGAGSEPEVLIPYANVSSRASDVMSFLFINLAETQADLVSYAPSLARSWEWSADSLQLTMHLRDDVRWSDGVPVTADDVLFSFDVGRDSVVGWRSRHWKKEILACDVVDSHTVRFRFDHVFRDQFRYAKEGFVIPKHLLGGVRRADWSKAAFGRAPVGCGPFVLERWDPQQRLVLARNPHYHLAGQPYLDRVVFEIVADATNRAAQLRAGQLDLVDELTPAAARDLRAVELQPATPARVQVVRGRTYDYIGYNLKDPRLADVRVREALTRAIDRDALVMRTCHGFAERFEGPIVPLSPAYDTTRALTPHDPDGARRLLAAAGWRDGDGDGWVERDGKRLELDVLVASDVQRRLDGMVLVQNDWKAIGVKANIVPLERNTTVERLRNRDFQAVCGGWGAALTINLQGLWGCSLESNNFTSYCNPELDRLNARALRLAPEAARPLWIEAQRLVVADHPYTWLYYLHDTIGIAKRLQGTIIDPRGTFVNPEEWWVTDAGTASR
jgi:peptide/nickel transport system substrate-binding protein